MSHPNPAGAGWRTSSYSSGNGACIQVATAPGGVIAVRDSKDQAGPRLRISAAAWQTFVQRAGRG